MNKIIESVIDQIVNESDYKSDFKSVFKRFVKNKFDDNASESDLKHVLACIEDEEDNSNENVNS